MDQIKALITGIDGFVGRHLAGTLLDQSSIHLSGTVFPQKSAIQASDCVFDEKIDLFPVDLKEPSSITHIIKELQPDWVFHLAAQSSVKDSIDNPLETFQTNVMGTAHLLEAVRQQAPKARVLLVGSAEVYGVVDEKNLPVTEAHPLNPANPYAASKAAADLIGYQAFKTDGTSVIRMRSFNHIGPGQNAKFVASGFAKQIAAIEAGQQEPVIRVGNLETRRDFTDVRDITAAYHLAIQRGLPGAAYNLCSGQVYSIREILDHLLSISTISIDIESDPDRLRPSDVPVLSGDNTLFCSTTGWAPKRSIQQTLRDILNEWRQFYMTEPI
jgi:GDP-4-dehydro-6-deoxy-D-mannose reductase